MPGVGRSCRRPGADVDRDDGKSDAADQRSGGISGHATDAARLDLALGRPVLVVDSTDVGVDGKPLVTKRSRFAAERVEFLVEET